MHVRSTLRLFRKSFTAAVAAAIPIGGLAMAACTIQSPTGMDRSTQDTQGAVGDSRGYFVRGTSSPGSANSAVLTISGPGSYLLSAKFAYENAETTPTRMGCTLWAGPDIDRATQIEQVLITVPAAPAPTIPANAVGVLAGTYTSPDSELFQVFFSCTKIGNDDSPPATLLETSSVSALLVSHLNQVLHDTSIVG